MFQILVWGKNEVMFSFHCCILLFATNEGKYCYDVDSWCSLVLGEEKEKPYKTEALSLQRRK